MEKQKKNKWELYYVRFHHPVPPAQDKEPVSEFTLTNKHKKYVVDSLFYTDQGVCWTAYGEANIVPLANVIYGRMVIPKKSPDEKTWDSKTLGATQ